jgi:hypothetical protein
MQSNYGISKPPQASSVQAGSWYQTPRRMRKTAVFIFLVLSIPVFAIEGIGEVTVGAALEGTDLNKKSLSSVSFTPLVTFNRDLVGSLNLFLGLNSSQGIIENDCTVNIPFNGDLGISFKKIDIILSYGLNSGPGRLRLAFRDRTDFVLAPEGASGKDRFFNVIRFGSDYGFPAGPGLLNCGLYAEMRISPELGGGALGFDLGFALDMGLSASTSVWFSLPSVSGSDFDWKGVWFEFRYAAAFFGAGLEGGLLDGLYLSLKPYCEFYAMYPGMTAGAYFKFKNLNSGMAIAPGVYVGFTF